MTNEEAIEQLKNYHYENGTVPQEIIIAIEALSNERTGEWIKEGEENV